jgi:hypothetical protein
MYRVLSFMVFVAETMIILIGFEEARLGRSVCRLLNDEVFILRVKTHILKGLVPGL